MATVDSVATTISNAITAANNNVADALVKLDSQLLSGYGIVGASANITEYIIDRNISITALENAVTSASTAVQGIVLGANIKSSLAYGTTETAIWSETFWTNLKTTLANALTVAANASVSDEVTGLTNNTNIRQSALYAADLERKNQVLRDAFSAANSATGARGFSYPNSMTTALKLAAQQRHMFDLSQVARDLLEKVFEWAKTSKEFLIEKQISAHMSDADFNLQYRRAADSAYIEEGRRLLEEYRQKMVIQIDVIEKALAALRVAIDAKKADAEISVQEIDLSLKKYAVDLQASVTSAQTMNAANASIAVAKLTAVKECLQAATTVATTSSNTIVGILNG